MAQHDYDLADATGAAFRADANLLFLAMASMNSGASEPATTFANMGWFDTANNLMKVRKEDDSGWITIAEKTATEWKPYWNTALMDAAFQPLTVAAATAITKTADETVNNSTTLQDDDHLVFAMAANITYVVDVILLQNAASETPDFKYGWTVPSGCTMFWGVAGDVSWGATAAAQVLLTEGSTDSTASPIGTDGTILKAIVRNGANAGNLQLRWAQKSAHASDCKILKHSQMIIRNLGAT